MKIIIQLKETWRYLRHEIIFPNQLAFGVWFLKTFAKNEYTSNLKSRLKKCEKGTIGAELLKFMDSHGFDFVPHYEKHDLKHVILGYKTNPNDEMRMQAFMFGNSGYPPIITLISLSFLIWTPEMWKDFKTHYNRGKQVTPLGNVKVDAVMNENLEAFRKQIGLTPTYYTI